MEDWNVIKGKQVGERVCPARRGHGIALWEISRFPTLLEIAYSAATRSAPARLLLTKQRLGGILGNNPLRVHGNARRLFGILHSLEG